jgi:GAF domain-containing protein
MPEAIRPTYQALVVAAVTGTGAGRGWLLRLEGDSLAVVAAAGGEHPISRVGTRRPIAGAAGFVVTSGQPAALRLRDDESNRGAGGAEGIPRSIVAAPCGADDIVGVLEVIDAPGGSFSFDDVELVSLLADIGGSAISEHEEFSRYVPSQRELLADMAALADADPVRYALVARALEAMLG